jgi:hypothetical protein
LKCGRDACEIKIDSIRKNGKVWLDESTLGPGSKIENNKTDIKEIGLKSLT